MLRAVYKNLCPNCGNDIDSERLNLGLFCEKCDSDGLKCSSVNLQNFKKFCIAQGKLREFNEFFKSKVGRELSPIQKMWAKRFFLGYSFSLLVPTGIGKTTFGLLLSAFVKNSYIVFPTKFLVLQTVERFKNWGIDALAYTGKKSEKERIKEGEYDILITTTQFLYKNKEIINKKFDLVFVDDVDSILKSARKIGDIFYLLRFSEEDIQKALELINKKDYEGLKKLSKKRASKLLVSSATANPRSKRVLLFRYLLGFEISRPNLTLRNIEDLYDEEYSWEKSVEWIKKLGRGGLLFLPGNGTREKLEEYVSFLNSRGIKAYTYEEFNEHLEEFKKGKCYFVGFASYRNPLARGIDLPEAVRYTLFVGVPKIELKLNEDNYKSIYFITLAVFPYLMRKNLLSKDEVFEIQSIINFFKNMFFLQCFIRKLKKN